MGRASRLKTNPERERHQREREIAALRCLRGCYAVDPSRSFETMVHAAAMHEAGHVVAALTLSFGLRFAVLRVQDDHDEQGVGGYTEVTLDFLRGPFDSPERAIAAATMPDALRLRTMQVLAGRSAESLVNQNDQDLDKGSEDDDKRAMAFARLALGPTSTSTKWTDYLND